MHLSFIESNSPKRPNGNIPEILSCALSFVENQQRSALFRNRTEHAAIASATDKRHTKIKDRKKRIEIHWANKRLSDIAVHYSGKFATTVMRSSHESWLCKSFFMFHFTSSNRKFFFYFSRNGISPPSFAFFFIHIHLNFWTLHQLYNASAEYRAIYRVWNLMFII